MHHPSWLFPGGCNVHGQPTDVASRDRSSNGNSNNNNLFAGFEINSFVRSLNRKGIQLPEGLMFKGTSVSNNNNNNDDNNTINKKNKEQVDANPGKSLNNILSILNDSVDRVVGWDAKDRSNSSSFASFISSHEDKDSAAWNDLINLVSTTAHEFRDINKSGNDGSKISTPRLDCPETFTIMSDIDPRKLSEPRPMRDEATPRDFPTDASSLLNFNDSRDNRTEYGRIKSFAARKISEVDLDVTPTNEDTRKSDLVEIYPEICRGSNVDGAQLGEESLQRVGQSETRKFLVNEILRVTGNSTDRNSSSWITPNKRINFEDESWPIGFGLTDKNYFPPYFTGRPSKTFGFRRNIERDSSWNVSRSSAIFVDAGEATAEIPALPARGDVDGTGKNVVTEKLARSIERSSEIPSEDNFLDARPIKLEETIADVKKCTENNSKRPKSLGKGSETSLDIPEDEKEGSTESRKNEDYGRKKRARAKVLVKRGRKVGKQTSTKNGRERFSTETEVKDTCSVQDVDSTNPTPRSSVRRTGTTRGFFGESCREMINNDDETIIVAEAQSEDSIDTLAGIIPKTLRPTRVVSNFTGKRSTNIAKRLKIFTPERNKTRRNCDTLARDHSRIIDERAHESTNERSLSARTYRSSVGSKQCHNRNDICDKERCGSWLKPVWKPGGSFKVVSSTSVSSVTKKSKIAQLIASITPRANNTSLVRSGIPSVRSQDPLKSAETETARHQRPATANESSKTRIPEYSRFEFESHGRIPRSLYSRETSRDRKKPLTRNGTTSAPGTNLKTTIPVLRSKTFVHQIRQQEPSTRRVVSKEDYSRSIGEQSTSTGSTRYPSTTAPVRQLFRKPLKSLSHVQRQVDLSSDTNFTDTPLDSRIGTDMERSRSDFRVQTSSKLKNVACSVEFGSNDSVVVDKAGDKRVPEINSEEKSVESKFKNKHARSLRMLKDILSHQGVNVERVKRETTEIRSRVVNDLAKKSQVSICTGQKKSFPVSGRDKDSQKISRTLFEKLAILAESQPERLDPDDLDARDSSDQFSSLMDLASDSVTSCARSTRDAGDQCSIGDESSMVSRTSIRSDKSSCSRNPREGRKQLSDIPAETNEHPRIICVDTGVSPVPSDAEFVRFESTKCFQVAETQTQLSVVDKDSSTEEMRGPVVDASTETITSASKEACTDFPERECKISKDAASGRDLSDVPSISRQVNTQSSDVFVKSRGVCFRGSPKVNSSSQVRPLENSRDAASGKDYVESQGVSEDVNTERQDYLYIDRSSDALGPETVEDSCQIEPNESRPIDVAVQVCSLDKNISRDFDRIEIAKDLDALEHQSSTNLDISRRYCGSLCSSSSSFITWRGSTADKFPRSIDRVPREVIVALEIARERGRNLCKAIEIYRENLATKKTTREHESTEINLSKVNRARNKKCSPSFSKHRAFRDNSMIKSLLQANLEKSMRSSEISDDSSSELPLDNTQFFDLEKDVTMIMGNLLTNVIRKIENVKCRDNGNSIVYKELFPQLSKRQITCPEVTIIVQDMNNIHESRFASTREKTLQFSFLSRNSLLTVVYGTVCSLVFWALQFSITCDSL